MYSLKPSRKNSLQIFHIEIISCRELFVYWDEAAQVPRTTLSCCESPWAGRLKMATVLLVQGVGPITSPLRGMVFLGWLTVISHQKDRDKCLLSLSSTFLPSTWKEWEEMVSELPPPRAEVGWFTVWEIHGALVTVGGTETGASTGLQEFFALCPLRIALPTTARPLSGWEWRYGYVRTWILSLRFCSFSFLVQFFFKPLFSSFILVLFWVIYFLCFYSMDLQKGL